MDVVPLVEQPPQPFGAQPREGVLFGHRTAEPDHVLRRIGALNRAPARAGRPLLAQPYRLLGSRSCAVVPCAPAAGTAVPVPGAVGLPNALAAMLVHCSSRRPAPADDCEHARMAGPGARMGLGKNRNLSLMLNL